MLPPKTKRVDYTLVLDLDETLVHFDHRRHFYRARPFSHSFLSQMASIFEIVIFTAGLKDYADSILNDFDRNGYIDYRLYRSSCIPKRGVFVKDLSRLGRDLSKTLIIDNIADNY